MSTKYVIKIMLDKESWEIDALGQKKHTYIKINVERQLWVRPNLPPRHELVILYVISWFMKIITAYKKRNDNYRWNK